MDGVVERPFARVSETCGHLYYHKKKDRPAIILDESPTRVFFVLLSSQKNKPNPPSNYRTVVPLDGDVEALDGKNLRVASFYTGVCHSCNKAELVSEMNLQWCHEQSPTSSVESMRPFFQWLQNAELPGEGRDPKLKQGMFVELHLEGFEQDKWMVVSPNNLKDRITLAWVGKMNAKASRVWFWTVSNVFINGEWRLGHKTDMNNQLLHPGVTYTPRGPRASHKEFDAIVFYE